MFGSHCINTYSQKQETTALSSGEWEFYGIAKAAAVGLGRRGLMEDPGVGVEAQVNTDSSAAKRMTARRGAVRVRRIDVREPRVQDRAATGELEIVKVKGEENVADGLKKHVDRQKMEQYMEACGMVRRTDRHELSPHDGDSVCFFLLETVLVRIVVFCPSVRWRHFALARFGADSSVVHDLQRLPR